MSLPRVGIIYLTYATPRFEEDINRCLRSLERMTYPKELAELICVESRSSIGQVKDWFQKTWMSHAGTTLPHITYIWNDAVIGFAGNNNIGYEKARELGCEYVYLLNEDTEVDPLFLEKAVMRALADPRVAIVQSFLLLGQDKNRVNSVGNAYHFLGFGYAQGYGWTREQAERFFLEEKKNNPLLEIGYASGAGVLIRMDALISVGGLFDEKLFSYHEDTDCSLLARIHGFRIVAEPASLVYHYYEEQKTQLKKNYWIERNRLVLVLSYYSWRTLALLFPLFFVTELGLFLFSLMGGWVREKGSAYTDVLHKDVRAWIGERRKRIQRVRVLSDRALLSHAVSVIAFQGVSVKNPVLDSIGNPLMKAYWWVVRRVI